MQDVALGFAQPSVDIRRDQAEIRTRAQLFYVRVRHVAPPGRIHNARSRHSSQGRTLGPLFQVGPVDRLPPPRTLNSLIDSRRDAPATVRGHLLRFKNNQIHAQKSAPALTDAEARVMAVLWQRQAATVGDVVARSLKERAVSYSTVQTILRILEDKGYVTHDKVARAFIYHPSVDERQARRRALRHLVTPAVQRLPQPARDERARRREIDPAELQRLKKLIEEA